MISHLSLLFVSAVMLIALTLYVLLAGADYGAGVWDLLATGPRKLQQRQFLEHAIGPIWEADHVWLILIVVILFTGFPPVFAAIMTSLNIPITLMLIGVVLRGSAFTFRSYGAEDAQARRDWGRLFSTASIITPLLLGVVIGAIASGKTPESPHRLSDFITPWSTPFCLSVGLMTVSLFAYLAATYAVCEIRDVGLSEDFRVRAIAAAIVAGALAAAILLLSYYEEATIWNGSKNPMLVWPLVCTTAILASTALFCLLTRRYRVARYCAAGQVALILWGWAITQFPHLLPPHLTIYNASAPQATLQLLAAALLAGSLVLLPSYKYLLDIFKNQRQRTSSPWSATERWPHVVIVGGGFAGLAAARLLSREPVRLTIVDRRNHFVFQPLLYQVASAALSPADIAIPIRHMVRHQSTTRVILGETLSVDSIGKTVALRDAELAFDYLIVASGAIHSYSGHDQWSDAAPGLKTLEQAIEIRRRVLVAFEAAEKEDDRNAQNDWLTFVIIGAGPTGVELAGAFSEISSRLLPDFTAIRTKKVRVVLMDMAPRILPTMSVESSKNAERQLRSLGVELMLNCRVANVDAAGVTYAQGRISGHTAVWAAGVAASALGRSLGAPVDRAGRVLVNQDLSVPKAPDIFVVGDLAAVTSDGKPVPGVAPAAMQEGRHAARNIAHLIRGEVVEPFRYLDKGALATIGRGRAVAEFGRLRLSGLVAWIAWLVIHIFYLAGFRRRVVVMAQWAWLYLWNERGARLITGDIEPLLARGHEDVPGRNHQSQSKGQGAASRYR